MANVPQPDVRSLLPFGKYWLDAELAEGGMSRVFRARLRGPGGFEKKLVVKQILPRLAQNPQFIELFVREANTLVQMSHPNIVPIYELGVVDGVYFLAMELVDGATVADLLRDGPLPQDLCAHIGLQVSEALRYAHERFGIVHRDVTPRNVMVDGDGHVRLLDFGIAAPAARTGQGGLFGSPGYMSPEQTRGEELSGQSDLFALGSLLYEALTRKPAVDQDLGVTKSLETSDRVHGELATLINECLAQDASARPRSAGETAMRFRTWLARHRPLGVALALGQRVEHAQRRLADPPARASAHATRIAGPSTGLTHSIATSASLSALLSEGTEPIARAQSELVPPKQAPSRAWRWALPLAITLALLALTLTSTPELPAKRAPKAQTSPSPQQVPAVTTKTEPPLRPAAPKQPPESAQSTRPLAARAQLSINALPWAELQLDGRALGSTPKRSLSIPAGNHLLELHCPPLGKSARVPIKLMANTHANILVDLRTEPPKVTVR